MEGGRALEDGVIKRDDAVFGAGELGELGALGEFAGGLDDERVVHEEQGLLGDGGLVAAAAGDVGAGEIELGEEFGRVTTVDEGVERAAGGEAFAAEADGLAADGGVEAAGDGEDGVVHLFEVEAADIGAPEEAVVGVLDGVGGVVGVGLLVGGAEDDEAVELFDGPAVLHEAGGKVVDQRGVAGRGGLVAEVVGRGDKAFAEVLLPDAVDEDAGGEGVGGAGDVAGEFEAAAALSIGGAVDRVGREDFKEAAGDDVGFVLGFAADEDGEVAGVAAVDEDFGAGRCAGVIGFEVAQLGLQHDLLAEDLLSFFRVDLAGAARGLKFLAEGGFFGGELCGLGRVVAVFGSVGDGEESGQVGDAGGLGATGKDAVEGIVILGRNGVEFVVVAAGAGDGEAEEGFGGDVDAVVNDVVGIAVELVAQGEEAHGSEDAAVAGGFFLGEGFAAEVLENELVGGELLGDEGGVGFVGVEGVDDVVSVGPGAGVAWVVAAFDLAFGVGEAGEVEPGAGGVFAVVGGGKEAVDDFGVGVGRGVGKKGLDFGFGGWEAGEVVGDAAEEGAAVGRGAGCHGGGFEVGEDKVVNGRAAPGGVLGGGHGRLDDGLEGPVVFGRGVVVGGGGGGGGGGGAAGFGHGRGGAGIGGAAANPFGEIGDDGVGEFAAFGGHAEVGVVVVDGLDEEAVVGLAGDDGGAAFATGQDADAGVKAEAGFEFIGLFAVAAVTLVGEDGADFGFEEYEVFRGDRRGRGRLRRPAGGEGDEKG